MMRQRYKKAGQNCSQKDWRARHRGTRQSGEKQREIEECVYIHGGRGQLDSVAHREEQLITGVGRQT